MTLRVVRIAHALVSELDESINQWESDGWDLVTMWKTHSATTHLDGTNSYDAVFRKKENRTVLRSDPERDVKPDALMRALGKLDLQQWQDADGHGYVSCRSPAQNPLTPEEHHALWVARGMTRGDEDADSNGG